MGLAMMMGVAQVMGTKPTLSLVFSSGPDASMAAALIASMGSKVPRMAARLPPPIARST